MAHSFIDFYVKFEYKFRYFILLFWAICLILGIVFGFKVLDETVNEVLPPSGSQAHAAQDLENELFPSFSAKQSTIHYFHSTNNKPLYNESEPDAACVRQAIKQICTDFTDPTKGGKYIQEQFGIVAPFDADGNLTPFSAGLISTKGTGVLINFALAGTDKQIEDNFKEFESLVNNAVSEACEDQLKSMIHGEVGMIKFAQDANDNALDDLRVMDSICLPISAVILIIMLRSIRLVLITVFATGSSILTSFLFLYPIAKWAMDVTTMAPTMMMALCLAISIDYSLFLLSRFRQELQKGEQIGRAIYATTFYAGRIVLLSGSILSLCFFSNIFLGNNMLTSLGFAAGFAALFNFTANMTIIPAMLFAFPRFFSDFSYFGLGTCLSRFCMDPNTQNKLNVIDAGEFRTDREILLESDEYKKALEDPDSIPYQPTAIPGGSRWDGTGTDVEQPNHTKEVEMGSVGNDPVSSEYPKEPDDPEHPKQPPPEPEKKADPERAFLLTLLQMQRKNFWYNVSRCSTHIPLSIVTVVVLLIIIAPFAYFYFGEMEQSLDNTQSFSQGSLTTELFNALGEDFSQGMMSPIDIVIDCRDLEGGSCWTEGFFCWAQKFIKEFVKNFPEFEGKPVCDLTDFRSPVMMGPIGLPYQLADILRKANSLEDARVAARTLLSEIGVTNTSEQDEYLNKLVNPFYSPYQYLLHSSLSTIDEDSEKVPGVLITLSVKLNPMGSDVYEIMPDFYDFTEAFIKETASPDNASVFAGGCSMADIQQMFSTDNGSGYRINQNHTFSITTKNASTTPRKPSVKLSPLLGSKYPYHSTKSKMSMGFAGSEVTQIDGVRSVFAKLPVAMAVTLVIIFIVVAVIFRSIVIPLRTVFTVFLTILLSLGLCTVVFQYHVLKYAISYLENYDTLYYFVPIFGYSIIIGFSLDYDIFLFYRVAEFRDKGYTDRAAILKASAQAQTTISAAGLIMSVAFFGLMFSKMCVMVEFGFLLFMTILMETFIIVPLLVTAICALLGPYMWWPGKRIHPTKTADDMSDQLPEKSTHDGENKKGIVCLRADPYTIQEWNEWMGFLPRQTNDTDESYEEKRLKCGPLMTAMEVMVGLYGEKCIAGLKAKQQTETPSEPRNEQQQEETQSPQDGNQTQQPLAEEQQSEQPAEENQPTEEPQAEQPAEESKATEEPQSEQPADDNQPTEEQQTSAEESQQNGTAALTPPPNDTDIHTIQQE